MIDVILTTLSVIATGAGALVAMWLVVSVLYTLGALCSAGRSRQRGTFHLRSKAGRCPLRYSGALHHRNDSGAPRGHDLRGIGKSPW